MPLAFLLNYATIYIVFEGGDALTPLCKKDYICHIIQIVVLLLAMVPCVAFIVYMCDDVAWLIFTIVYALMLLGLLFDSIYWICQPNVLIWQYDTGIVIQRNIKIEYKEIERIYRKNYLAKKRRGNYYRDPYIGTIFIKLKSGKFYRVRNAFYPLEAVDVISKMKQQRKFS